MSKGIDVSLDDLIQKGRKHGANQGNFTFKKFTKIKTKEFPNQNFQNYKKFENRNPQNFKSRENFSKNKYQKDNYDNSHDNFDEEPEYNNNNNHTYTSHTQNKEENKVHERHDTHQRKKIPERKKISHQVSLYNNIYKNDKSLEKISFQDFFLYFNFF